MRSFIGNRELIAAATPVIIHAKDRQVSSLAADYSQYELSSMVHSSDFPVLRNFGPLQNTISRVRPFYSLSEFSVLPEFDYMSGIFSGPILMDIMQDSRTEAVWPDRVEKGMLQLRQPYPYADPSHTYSVYPAGSTKQQIYFTSMEMVRHLIGADIANRAGYMGQNVTCVVSDTGGSVTNPALTHLRKESAIDHIFTDEIGHGSWCAAAIGGQRVTDETYSSINKTKPPVVNEGIAPSCNLLEIKSLDFVTGVSSDSILIKSLAMAIRSGADVLSCSWGGSSQYSNAQSDPFYIPMQRLVDAGIIPVVAAGNSGPAPKTIASPGYLPQPLTVGAYNVVTNDGKYAGMFGKAGMVSGFSSRGPTPWNDIKPDTVMPGAVIDNAISGYMTAAYSHVVHREQAISGTSMATPIAAGLIALMRQYHAVKLNKKLTVTEVKKMLSSLGHTKNNVDGWGPLTWQMYIEWVSTQYGGV